MLMRYSNNGGQAKLWCVELVPKKKKLGDAGMKRAVELAKGIPKDPERHDWGGLHKHHCGTGRIMA